MQIRDGLVDGDKEEILLNPNRAENVSRKYSKLLSWMIHGMPCIWSKAIGMFWEKEYGTAYPTGYDTDILSKVDRMFNNERSCGHRPVFQLDNIPCHKSRLTKKILDRGEITTIHLLPKP